MFRTKSNPFVSNEAKVIKGLMCPVLQAPGLSHLEEIFYIDRIENQNIYGIISVI